RAGRYKFPRYLAAAPRGRSMNDSLQHSATRLHSSSGSRLMELTDLAWPAVAALPKTTPVIFPIAALEQHGRHMPVFTDSLLLGEVIRRVKQTPAADKCLFAPLQWLGNSHHHLDFPGTLSASPRAYLDLLKDLASNFLAHGFTR